MIKGINYGISSTIVLFHASVIIVTNGEKLEALPVYSSFRGVATSSLRRISVSISSGS